MDAAMFGTPGGTRAAEEDQRLNAQSQVATLLHGVQAQEVLGKIAMQPAANELALSLGRLHRAEAEAKEAEARSTAFMGQAMGQISAAGAGAGATPGRPASAAAPLRALAEIAREGQLFKPFLDLQGKIANIEEKEAIRDDHASRAVTQTLTAKQKVLEERQHLAMGLLSSPENYRQSLMQAASQGMNVSGLTGDYAMDKPQLEFLRDSSIKAADGIRLAQQKVLQEAEVRKFNKQAEAAGAAAKTNGMRYNILNQLYENREKNDGENSPGAAKERASKDAARKARDENAKEALRLRDLAKYPPAPADPTKRIVGSTYTWPDGSKVLWTVNPATGKPGAQLVQPAKKAAEMTDAEIEQLIGPEPTGE